jgi:hypothetical protein
MGKVILGNNRYLWVVIGILYPLSLLLPILCPWLNRSVATSLKALAMTKEENDKNEQILTKQNNEKAFYNSCSSSRNG